MDPNTYNELREKAEKKVQAKMSFYVCSIVFFFVTIVLLMLSSYIPSIAIWLKLPIPIFIMVLGILYLYGWGLPIDGSLSEEWQEDEIEREMIKMYRQEKNQKTFLEELEDEEELELKDIEILKEKRRLDS